MSHPILAEALRGGQVESVHRGSLAVLDPTGAVVVSLGDIDRPVFSRSAAKALQALPLVEGGAAARFALEDRELALACASHSGEPEHVATAAGMLAKAGLAVSALACGSHWPLREAAARALAAEGQLPCPLHNNCSGKHAGFLCLAAHEGHDPVGYAAPTHPTMRLVTATLAAMTGRPLAEDRCAIDGCSIPAFAVPLRSLALAFARFGTGVGLPPVRAAAAARLRAAVAASPFHVAGTGRFDTEVMEALGTAAFVKLGAEGVQCGSLPGLGLGFALKIDDGATRAADVVAAHLLGALLRPEGEAARVTARWAAPTLRNWNGMAVGALHAAEALRDALPWADGPRAFS